MTEEDKRPEILKDLWTGELIWCGNCGHHVDRHQTGRVPLCDYDATSNLEKGRYECPCKEFKGISDLSQFKGSLIK